MFFKIFFAMTFFKKDLILFLASFKASSDDNCLYAINKHNKSCNNMFLIFFFVFLLYNPNILSSSIKPVDCENLLMFWISYKVI